MVSPHSFFRMHWDHEPTPSPSKEGSRTAWPGPFPGGGRGGTLNLPGKSKAPQGRRTPKPGRSSGDLGQRASVVECGGPPPLSKGARTRNTYGSWKASSALRRCIGTINRVIGAPNSRSARYSLGANRDRTSVLLRAGTKGGKTGGYDDEPNNVSVQRVRRSFARPVARSQQIVPWIVRTTL